jgi:hypothetical protein
LAVLAVQQIRRMRGGAQGQLMLGADGHVYVVKFQNNPQHTRVLANELMASRLAAAAGLTVPQTELVEVSSWLIENTPELEIDLGQTHVRCQAGLQFGSRFAGGTMPGQVVDFLPRSNWWSLRISASLPASWRWINGRAMPTGGRRRKRALERDLQRNSDKLCLGCLAGRCAAFQCAFDQPERASCGADSQSNL